MANTILLIKIFKNGKIDGEAPTRMSVYKNVKYLTPKKWIP